MIRHLSTAVLLLLALPACALARSERARWEGPPWAWSKTDLGVELHGKIVSFTVYWSVRVWRTSDNRYDVRRRIELVPSDETTLDDLLMLRRWRDICVDWGDTAYRPHFVPYEGRLLAARHEFSERGQNLAPKEGGLAVKPVNGERILALCGFLNYVLE